MLSLYRPRCSLDLFKALKGSICGTRTKEVELDVIFKDTEADVCNLT